MGREARKRRGKAPKIKAVKELTQHLKNGQGFLLLNNKGLTLAEATTLRAKLRENNVVLKVIKNTLLARALKRAGYNPKQFEHLLKDETVVAIGMDDPVTPAKLLVDFIKDHEKLMVKGGYVEGQILDAAGVVELSKLPGREELLQRLLGSLQSPAQNLVYALNACVSQPVYLLDAVRRQKEEEAAA